MTCCVNTRAVRKVYSDKHLEIIITSIIYTNILFMQYLIVLILNISNSVVLFKSLTQFFEEIFFNTNKEDAYI